jgi:hypothetical protein
MSLQIVAGAAGSPPTPAPLPRGLVRMAMADYQKDPALSRSVLDKIAVSPAHLQHYLQRGGKDSPALREGRVLHTLLLEPEFAGGQIAVRPERPIEPDRPDHLRGVRRKGEGKGECEVAKWEATWRPQYEAELAAFGRFDELNAGKEILTLAELQRPAAMAASARRRAHVVDVLDKAVAVESSAFAERRGVRVKCRPDIIGADGWVWDIKTAADASYAGFQRSAWNFGYHRQAAWYLDVLERATGIAYEGFAMIVIEKEAPYEVALYRMTAEQIARGREENEENFERYRACVTSDTWPGYASEPQALFLPEWGQL